MNAGLPTRSMRVGDYITLAEKLGNAYWLLAGSEIRANSVASARKEDRRLSGSCCSMLASPPICGDFRTASSCSSIGGLGTP